MKGMWVGFLIISLLGCASTNPVEHILLDKEFEIYRADLDRLEKEYLRKEISYAQYLQEKKALENHYQMKIKTRKDALQNQNQPSPISGMVP